MEIGILKIHVYGDPCLRKKSVLVEEVGPSERILIKAMLKTMYENQGIGLAAPQVGINQQIFVADIGEGPIAMINPEVIAKKGKCFMEEGCLSLPGVVVNVKRPQMVQLKYLDESNVCIAINYFNREVKFNSKDEL